MQWISEHKLLFVVVIVVLGAALWYGMSATATPAPLLVTSGATGSPSLDAADQQLVSTLLALRAVTLSGTIFSDPAFLALQDFSTPIVPEPVGRDNPFAPLGRTATSSSSSQTQQLFTPAR